MKKHNDFIVKLFSIESKEEREKLLLQLTKFDDFQAVYALQKKAA